MEIKSIKFKSINTLTLTTTSDLESTCTDWADALKPVYLEVEKVEEAVLASCLNAVLTQRIKAFVFTRTLAEKLLAQDKNLPANLKEFSRKVWPKLFAALASSGHFNLVQKGSSRQPSVWEVVEPAVVENLKEVNREEQVKNCLNFVSNRSPKNKGDKK
jgi:hypothetical protein